MTGVQTCALPIYTKTMRGLIADAERAADALEADWHNEVALDMAHLGPLAKAEDYPTSIRGYYYVTLQFRPVPAESDWRVTISDEDKASMNSAIAAAEANAAKHIIRQMLEPMAAAAKRLTEYRGQKGERFRDSTILNMVEVVDRMARVNISDDPAITDQINALRSLVSQYANNIDVLKQSQTVRDTARSQIETLMGSMSGLL